MRAAAGSAINSYLEVYNDKQQRLAEFRVALRPRPDGCLEVVGQGHRRISRFYGNLFVTICQRP